LPIENSGFDSGFEITEVKRTLNAFSNAKWNEFVFGVVSDLGKLKSEMKGSTLYYMTHFIIKIKSIKAFRYT
jgi:hypothetical protein